MERAVLNDLRLRKLRCVTPAGSLGMNPSTRHRSLNVLENNTLAIRCGQEERARGAEATGSEQRAPKKRPASDLTPKSLPGPAAIAQHGRVLLMVVSNLLVTTGLWPFPSLSRCNPQQRRIPETKHAGMTLTTKLRNKGSSCQRATNAVRLSVTDSAVLDDAAMVRSRVN